MTEFTRKPSQTTTRRAWSGLWTSLAGQIVAGVLQLAFIVVASRLLLPSDFGAMAVAATSLRFISYFSGLSIAMAIVRATDLSRQLIQTARSVSLLLGLVATGTVALAAPILAALVDAPAVSQLIVLMAPSLLVSAFGEVATGVMRRGLRFAELAIIDVVAYAVGYVAIGIGLAASGFGALSLAAALLATSLARSTLVNLRSDASCRLAWDPREVRYLLGYGSGLSVLNLSEYLVSTLPLIAVGRVLGLTATGHYNRAQVLLQTPSNYVIPAVQRVLGGVAPRLSGARAACTLLQVHAVVVAVLGVFAAVVATNSSAAVYLLFGRGYHQAAELVPVISIAVVLASSTAVLSLSLESRGHLKRRYHALAASVGTLMLGLLIAWETSSLRTFAIAWLAAEMVKATITLVALRRDIPGSTRTGWYTLASALALTIVAGISSVFGREATTSLINASSEFQFAAAAAFAVGASLTFVRAPGGKPLREALSALGLGNALPTPVRTALLGRAS